MANSRKAIVRILTDHPGFIDTVVGIGLQAIETEVIETNRLRGRYVIVGAYNQPSEAGICDEIARNLRPRFKGANIYFMGKESEGEAEIYVPSDEQAPDPFLVASAVGVLKISWGWEEVNTMKITFPNVSVKVAVKYENNSWVARLTNIP